MRLLVICGPTATGKTALGAGLAHRLGTELISADSRQIYRGLDLGTGKDLQEYQKFTPPVRYHLIDIAEPESGYSLYQYQRDCYRLMDACAQAGGRTAEAMVMAGGTGMYMEAVLRHYRIANVPENPALRESLAGRSRDELEAELKRKDPDLAARSDLSSGKRIIRALEVWHAGQSQPVEFSRPPERGFSFTVFGTRMDRTALRARIDARLEERLAAGMVEEVEGLLKRGVTRERMQVLGMEYREISDYLAGDKSRDEMAASLRHEIHLLAKRQETYFRGMERRGVPITWLEPGQGVDGILELWNRGEASHG
ncbi:MAG: tRNA delta(2)-isopentenylpyrophosphate transferase [Fibrobacteres bacterium]|nr:tRNA delta(2)-isopentenylpyrophosphate transferase [Fibrobacterota bacterium]